MKCHYVCLIITHITVSLRVIELDVCYKGRKWPRLNAAVPPTSRTGQSDQILNVRSIIKLKLFIFFCVCYIFFSDMYYRSATLVHCSRLTQAAGLDEWGLPEESLCVLSVCVGFLWVLEFSLRLKQLQYVFPTKTCTMWSLLIPRI